MADPGLNGAFLMLISECPFWKVVVWHGLVEVAHSVVVCPGGSGRPSLIKARELFFYFFIACPLAFLHVWFPWLKCEFSLNFIL